MRAVAASTAPQAQLGNIHKAAAVPWPRSKPRQAWVEPPAWRRRPGAAPARRLVALAAPQSGPQRDDAFDSSPSDPNGGPRSPFQALLHVVKAVLLVMLSPLLLAGTVLAFAPPELPEAVPEPSKYRKLGCLAWLGFNLLVFKVLIIGVEQLGRLSAPPAVEAFCASLLGDGKVGKVLAYWCVLPMPSSPTMQLLSVAALYATYKTLYWFEWWWATMVPGASPREWMFYDKTAPEWMIRLSRKLLGPRTWALLLFCSATAAPFHAVVDKLLAALHTWLLRHGIALGRK